MPNLRNVLNTRTKYASGKKKPPRLKGKLPYCLVDGEPLFFPCVFLDIFKYLRGCCFT